MIDYLPHGAQEVADAMAATFEREDLAGSQLRWCPERDAIAVRRWIVDRSRDLGGGIRRVVRFARLAAIAGGGDHLRFLYDTRIPSLRAPYFKATLLAARACGRLSQGQAMLSPTGVTLIEPCMCPAGGEKSGFVIDFAQMPRLAALLDILHNALGYAVVADILEPILVRDTPHVHADEVARVLHAKLNGWLSDRLDSPHYIRQGQTMRAFLAGRGPLAPEVIDNEAILSFWISISAAPEDSRIEGFRLFTSAARAMLRYRCALRDQAAYGAIGAPLALDDNLDHDGCETALGMSSELARPRASPLWGLATHPASAVKWLTKRERLRLLNYLGGPHPGSKDGDPDWERQDSKDDDRGLAGGERFDLRLVRTLLRADVFGTAQAGIVARMRKRIPAAVAIAEAMAPATDDAYEACASAYARVREQLRMEALAALVVLFEHGAVEALVLVGHLAGRDAVREVLQLARVEPSDADAANGVDALQQCDLSTERRQAIASALRSIARERGSADGGSLSALLAQAHAARPQVNRIGFRPEDRADPSLLAALQGSVHAVADALAELDRLLSAFPQAAHADAVSADRPRFGAAFRDAYGAVPTGD